MRELKDWIPKFYGTLRLEGRVQSDAAPGGVKQGAIEPVPEAENKDEHPKFLFSSISI